jgi:hypothetical protein
MGKKGSFGADEANQAALLAKRLPEPAIRSSDV